MNLRDSGRNQLQSAVACGFSERTARRIDLLRRINESAVLHNKSALPRNYRTRKDPLEEVWPELESLLASKPDLQPLTLFEYLEDKYPGKYSNSILRTLQRRIKDFRVLNQDNEVMFLQKHHPGVMGISDFTHVAGVTIEGEQFNHRLYHYRLVYSRWSYAKIILGGESYTALAEGLQNALIKCGGAPKEHRTDSLSAAFNNNQQELTAAYQQLCDHYSIKPTRNNLGKGHENGSIESAHGHVKNRIRQALLLRDSSNFPSIKDYQGFIDKIVERHNRKCSLFTEEQKTLTHLPNHRAADFTTLHVITTSCSTINIKRVVYSVPSRLIGTKLTIHLFDDRLEVFYNGKKTCELARIHNSGKRASSIDYRHIINSLVQKPQAFKNFIWKDDLFPSPSYKTIWDIVKQQESKLACKYFVKLLYLASKIPGKEDELSGYVLNHYQLQNNLPTIEDCSRQLGLAAKKPSIPVILTYQHSLADYSSLLLVSESSTLTLNSPSSSTFTYKNELSN